MNAARPPRRRPPRQIIVALVLALAAGAWWLYDRSLAGGPIGGDGSIEATPVDVTTESAGRVMRLAVLPGQSVKRGAVLAELEPAEAGAQVAAAEAAVRQADTNVAGAQAAVTSQAEATSAQVAQANAQIGAAGTVVPQAEMALAIQERTYQNAVTQAQAQVRAAGAQVRAARSAQATARSNLAREKALFAQGAVAAQDVDTVQTAYDTAAAQMQSATDTETQAQAALGSAEANLRQVAIQREAVAAARANLAQAQAGLQNAQSGYAVLAQRRQALAGAVAALAQARENLKYLQVIAGHTVIAAPMDGTVQTQNVQAGEVVAAGAALYTLLDPQDLFVRIFIREDRIGRVMLGQAAAVTVDVLPGQTFAGRVTQINDTPEFTTVNVQTKEDRVKLVFGVKIRLDDAGARPLQAGMPAHVRIAAPRAAGVAGATPSDLSQDEVRFGTWLGPRG
jgi:HlyD family secretion protein